MGKHTDEQQSTDQQSPEIRTQPNVDANTEDKKSFLQRSRSHFSQKIKSKHATANDRLAEIQSHLPISTNISMGIFITYILTLPISGILISVYQPIGILNITVGGLAYYSVQSPPPGTTYTSKERRTRIMTAILFTVVGVLLFFRGILYDSLSFLAL